MRAPLPSLGGMYVIVLGIVSLGILRAAWLGWCWVWERIAG